MPPFALVFVAAAIVLGTFAVEPLPADERMLAGAGIAILSLLIASGRFGPRTFRAVILFALVAGAVRATFDVQSATHVTESRTERFSGFVLAVRDADAGNLYQYTTKLDNGLTVLMSCSQHVGAGTHVIVRGRLEPLDDARNPDEPSERIMERERGIEARIGSAAIVASDNRPSNAPQEFLARAHAWALAQLQLRLGEPAASIVAGELWGERGDLPPELRTEFQETGTVHVLVTAGLHVGLAATLLAALLSLFALPRTVTCAIGIAGVWAFALWSGGDLPALRAATMATYALAARAYGASVFSWNALAAAAVTVALWMPQSVATPSFALSFSCVGAIFACAPTIESLIDKHIALPHRVREALVLTTATQLGTWPITAAVFLQFSSYALFANLAVVPCVPATMLLGALQIAFAWCSPLAQALANINGWIVAWVVGSVHTLATLPGAAVPMTPGPAWCILAYDAALLALPLLLRRNGATLAATLLLVATSIVLWPPRAHDRLLRITVLDVGQADSIVIQTPAGHTFLVDAGGLLERNATAGNSAAERVGERVVVPFLLRHGIHSLDALIVSHPHGDHVGGCSPVLHKLRVAVIADSGQRYGGHAYHDCLDTAAADRVPVVQARADALWRTNDGVTLTFVGPSLPFISGKNAINDNSIAFILQYRSFRMLFTGDAGVDAERRFLGSGLDLHADVLKVGHHGSAYSSSSEFIKAVHPRYAVISVGRHNLFGHPAPSTVATLRQFGATIYRTDQDAAVSILTNGSSTRVTAALEERAPEAGW